MADLILRLVHAGDFHLEDPLHGMDEVPGNLRELAMEAPYLAAEQVFETAVAREAALVLLAGDIVDPRAADSRAAVFLVQQFARLAERNIEVYWAGGAAEHGSVERLLEFFPDNVHWFAAGRVEQLVACRDGEPIARLLGFSAGRGNKPRTPAVEQRDDGVPTVGVGYGAGAAKVLRKHDVDYAALGGRHNRQHREGVVPVHFPGTPQGRSFREAGPHGCTVVEIGPAGPPQTTFVATDVVRWVDATIEADECPDRDHLLALLDRELERLGEEARGLDLLVRWTVTVRSSRWVEMFRRGDLATELCADLRRRHGGSSPAAWSVSLAVDLPDSVPAGGEDEQTILGDFLRAVREYQADAARPLALDQFLPDDLRTDSEMVAAALPEGEARRRVLDQVARLGADLLGR